MNTDITAKGSIRDDMVTATLTLGAATLTLTYPQHDEEAVDDMAFLVEKAEDSFVKVITALVSAATTTSPSPTPNADESGARA